MGNLFRDNLIGGIKSMFKRFVIIAMVGVFGLAGFIGSEKPAAASQVTFTSEMHGSKNLTNHGMIKYYVKADAKKYQGDIQAAANKWNHALGRRLFRPTSSLTQSRLAFTGTTQLAAGYAGMAEVNSEVIALNDRWMQRYSHQKRQAVVIHEMGHTMGTSDLYDYSDPILRRQFKRLTIMGGNYHTTMTHFDVSLAKWSLKKTHVMSNATFQGYRANQGLFYQQMIHGKL